MWFSVLGLVLVMMGGGAQGQQSCTRQTSITDCSYFTCYDLSELAVTDCGNSMCTALKSYQQYFMVQCPPRQCASGTSRGAYPYACTPCPPASYFPTVEPLDTQNTIPYSCRSCPTGTYQNTTGQTVCRSCEPGKYQNTTGQTMCQTCQTGKYQGAVNQTACRACEPGKYQDTTGQTVCLSCESGTYQDTAGQTMCQTCQAGSYQNTTGRSDCLACPPGKYQGIAGQSTCLACGPGKYQDQTGQSQCSACPPAPTGFYQVETCHGTSNGTFFALSACPAGQRAVTERGGWRDTICGSVEQCKANSSGLAVYDWITSDETCRKGEYLWGLSPPPGYAKICQRCPEGMVGLNGVFCERCGALQQPYYLDQASCVCVESAVMNASGVCVCPDGYTLEAAGSGPCVECGKNTYGAGGACYACGPGYVSPSGAVACDACGAGAYRTSNQSECTSCGQGWYTLDATGCRRCNTSCPVGTTSEPCPGNPSGNYSLCAGCTQALPGNASWTSGCAYDCHAGFYRTQGGCGACTTNKACPPGFKASACGAQEDANCDTACANASKPEFYSKWIASSDCRWGCESGYGLVVTDYWMFKIFECVPGG